MDASGLPVSGVPVTWSAGSGATLTNAAAVTDSFGVAEALPILGPQPGSYSYQVTAGGMSHTFTGFARAQPIISSIIDAASSAARRLCARVLHRHPGIRPERLHRRSPAAPHPLAIDLVSVSFDVPSAHISVPGHLIYVSPTQINVQVPWELQGQTVGQVKVNVDFSPSNVVTVSLASAAPAFFVVQRKRGGSRSSEL